MVNKFLFIISLASVAPDFSAFKVRSADMHHRISKLSHMTPSTPENQMLHELLSELVFAERLKFAINDALDKAQGSFSEAITQIDREKILTLIRKTFTNPLRVYNALEIGVNRYIKNSTSLDSG